MKIEFAQKKAVEDNEVDAFSIIVATIIDGWHSWSGTDSSDRRLSEYVKAFPRHAEILDKSFTGTAYMAPTKTMKIDSASGMGVTFTAAYVRQPLLVLVENSTGDATFFERALTLIRPELANKLNVAHPAWDFVHGGGKAEIRNLLRTRRARAAVRGVPERLVVIVDSDALYPGHSDSDTNSLRDLCSDLGIPLHVLQKRAIENYASDRLIDSYKTVSPESADAAEFVKSLTSKQRDHYPMKKTFRGDATLSAGEIELYRDLDHDKIYKYRLPRVMSAFLSDSAARMLDQDMSDRQSRSEFETISSLIEKEL